jgi:uncharacterized glyoxalase superfamily protein PhnB
MVRDPPGARGDHIEESVWLFARATAAGARVLRQLHDTDYRSRDFAVVDPEGNHWSFGTYRGEARVGSGG